MRLPHAARAHQQESMLCAEGEFSNKTLHSNFCLSETLVPRLHPRSRDFSILVVRLVIIEVAVAIALRHAGLREDAFVAIARRAIARHGPHHLRLARGRAALIGSQRLRTLGRPLDDLPPTALANGTIRSRHDASIRALPAPRKPTPAVQIAMTCGFSEIEEAMQKSTSRPGL